MNKSRKGYIMGSKLQRTCGVSPLKSTPSIDYMGNVTGVNFEKKDDKSESGKSNKLVEDVKNIGSMLVTEKTVPKKVIQSALITSAPSSVATTVAMPLAAGAGAIHTLKKIGNYMDEHGTPVQTFQGRKSWQELSKESGGPTIKDTRPNYLLTDKELKERQSKKKG